MNEWRKHGKVWASAAFTIERGALGYETRHHGQRFGSAPTLARAKELVEQCRERLEAARRVRGVVP